MKTYAWVVNGGVVEIIPPLTDKDGNEIPIENRFCSEMVYQFVDVTNIEGIAVGWLRTNSGFSPPAPKTQSTEEVRAVYEAAAQAMLDNFANSWGYDTCERMISYVGSSNLQWDAEGKAGRQYRDDVWAAAHGIDVSVSNGGTPPANEAAFLAMLPQPPARPTV